MLLIFSLTLSHLPISISLRWVLWVNLSPPILMPPLWSVVPQSKLGLLPLFLHGEISPARYLFAFKKKHHVDRILAQAPWNVCGSLLALERWSPLLALKEIDVHFCNFWVQIHGLPLLGMTITTAIRIGKALGTLLEVDDFASLDLSVKAIFELELPLILIGLLCLGFFSIGLVFHLLGFNSAMNVWRIIATTMGFLIIFEVPALPPLFLWLRVPIAVL
ncbi:hypothetical protein SLA2020_282210 [Shorea laevis]